MTEPTRFTLQEALLRWGNQAAVTEMLELKKKGYDAPILVIGRTETEDDRKAFRYRKLRGDLEAEIMGLLQGGPLISTGYDSRSPIDALESTIRADRWRVLTPNFDDSSAAGKGFEITGILVSSLDSFRTPKEVILPEPPLQIARAARRARLYGRDLNLTPRSFDLLVLLAEGAIQGAVPVPKRNLEGRLLPKDFSDKALGQMVNRLKNEMIKSGIDRESAQSLIANIRAVGYCLTLSSSDIRIED